MEELHAAADHLRGLQAQEAADRETLAGLVREHARREKLLERIVAETSGCRDAEARLAALPALPPEAVDPEAFLKAQDADKRERDELRGRERKLAEEYVRAEENQPEESSEELAGRRDDADRRHRQALHRARALRAVQAASEQVLSQDDRGAQQGFERALAGFAAELTAARYRAMPLTGGLPDTLEREDGLRLPFDYLSGGHARAVRPGAAPGHGRSVPGRRRKAS